MFDSENKRRHIKAGGPSAGKQTADCVTVTALPSDRHFLMQQDAKGQRSRRCYFSDFTESWSEPGLQFLLQLWSKKSTLSNYTVLPRDDVKMITVYCVHFPLHQSEGPEPTRTGPVHKVGSVLFQGNIQEKYIFKSNESFGVNLPLLVKWLFDGDT